MYELVPSVLLLLSVRTFEFSLPDLTDEPSDDCEPARAPETEVSRRDPLLLSNDSPLTPPLSRAEDLAAVVPSPPLISFLETLVPPSLLCPY